LAQALRKAIRQQLNYVKRNRKSIEQQKTARQDERDRILIEDKFSEGNADWDGTES